MIDTKVFLENWDLIWEKLEKISGIQKPDGNGERFSGIEINDQFITYNSETYYSGCGTDHFSFDVSWDEINHPIEYFKEKYAKQIADKEKLAEENKKKAEQHKEESDRALFEQLKKKFES